MAAAAWLVGAPLTKIGLFFGPTMKEFKLGNVVLAVSYIPYGGYIKCSDDFQKVHPIKQIFIPICGCLVLLILAMGVFGSYEAFQKFVRGWYQVLSGAFSPRVIGANLLVKLYKFAVENSFVMILGLVASKLASMNLLPLPSLNGGYIILTLLNWIKPMSLKLRDLLQQLGFAVTLMGHACWIVAFYYFLVLF